MYHEKVAFPVYCSDCWWSDKWGPWQYGQDFDFKRPFFEQFMELANQVPHFALAVLGPTMENSDYCNQAGYLKNCYLLFNSDQSEQCLYGKGVNRCFNCVDCFKVYDCQSCYESLNCNNCSFSSYLLDSHNSSECHFSSNLIGCNNCFGSVNLRNKQFCFFDEQLFPEEYKLRVEKIIKEKTPQQIWQQFGDFRQQHIMKWMQERNTENCTGDYLVQCKNCFSCFDSEFLENSKYCCDLKKGGKISFENYDISYFGEGVDASYEGSVIGYNANHVLFCEDVWQSHDVFYSQFCMQNSHDCFGCVGLKHGEYGIFNKKYSKEEYEKLASKIIEHMEKTAEWGEFFSIKFSQFGYNEATVFEYFPLEKEEVLEKKWPWYDEKDPDYSNVKKVIPAKQLPRTIAEVGEDILDSAIQCEQTSRLFKIQKAELNFYRKMNLPLPHLHPDVRHLKRLALRNHRKLHDRKCAQCSQDIQTTYDSKRPEKVLCENCYLKEIY